MVEWYSFQSMAAKSQNINGASRRTSGGVSMRTCPSRDGRMRWKPRMKSQKAKITDAGDARVARAGARDSTDCVEPVPVSGAFMAARACLARLRKEYKNFEPPPYIRAAPLENNLQEWRFVLQGPPDSPYEGGMYQGKVKFPDDYPFKPPSIYMLTPSGRFETDRRLCLSISDFHPETWVPTWSVASILNGVLSFMLESSPTTGSVETTVAEKHRLRDKSVAFNAKDAVFCALFPELVDGTPFTDPLQKPASVSDAAQAPATAAAAAASQPTAAPAATAEMAADEEAGDLEDGGEAEAGSGKNAAKNKCVAPQSESCRPAALPRCRPSANSRAPRHLP